MPKQNTRLAIIYDFDGTLAPGNLQENSFIPDIDMKPQEFWEEVNKQAKQEQADPILVYMDLMLRKAKSARVPARLADFRKRGSQLSFFVGVEDWFDRINQYARSKSVRVEHYVVSSGNGEIIDGTPIASKFTRIYASRFMFDDNGAAYWPALAVNFTTKTQFLFRINKDAHDLSDDKKINEFVHEEERPIPFRNMIFVGDGETDVPCFRLVKQLGGFAIAVYKPNVKFARKKAEKFLGETYCDAKARVHAVVPADYRENRNLDKVVKGQIDFVAARNQVDRLSAKSRSTNGQDKG